MDVPTFKKRFPEFEHVNAQLVVQALSEAQRWVDPVTWGTFTDDGLAYYMADVLTTSPMGGATRMAEPKGDAISTYKKKFDELADIVSCGQFLTSGGNRFWRCP